jgi:hypothetical protein
MSVFCDCCVLSSRDLCDGPILRTEESFLCDLEPLRNERTWTESYPYARTKKPLFFKSTLRGSLIVTPSFMTFLPQRTQSNAYHKISPYFFSNLKTHLRTTLQPSTLYTLYTSYKINFSPSSSFTGVYNPLTGFSLLILEVSRSHV